MRTLLFLLLLAPVPAFAHGDSPSLEAEVGEYFIDIGHEELRPDDDIEFGIDLFAGDPIDYADFASVDVRVAKDGAELVSGTVENDAVNVPVFTVRFPEPGGYDMDVRFLDANGALLVARTFHLEVPSSGSVMLRDGFVALHYVIAAALFALSAGIAGYALWQRFGPKK